jgi:hypothetical protein
MDFDSLSDVVAMVGLCGLVDKNDSLIGRGRDSSSIHQHGIVRQVRAVRDGTKQLLAMLDESSRATNPRDAATSWKRPARTHRPPPLRTRPPRPRPGTLMLRPFESEWEAHRRHKNLPDRTLRCAHARLRSSPKLHRLHEVHQKNCPSALSRAIKKSAQNRAHKEQNQGARGCAMRGALQIPRDQR